MPTHQNFCAHKLQKIKENIGQSGFRPGRNTTDQIFTLKQIFEKSWEYGKDLFACLVDVEKHMTEFLGINFARFCGSMALMVNCYVP